CDCAKCRFWKDASPEVPWGGALAGNTAAGPQTSSKIRIKISFHQPTLKRDGDDLTSWLGKVTPTPHHNFRLLEDAAARWSHFTALECGVTGRSLTYGALRDLWRRCGGALAGRGVTRGQNVALLMLNSPDFAVVFGGVFATGATSPINPSFTPGEIARQVQNSRPTVLISDARLETLAEAALALLPAPPPLLLMGGGGDGGRGDLLEEAQDKNTPFAKDVEVQDEDNCVLLYSSGTTGVPKGAPTRQGSIRHNLPAVLHPGVNPYREAEGDWQETVLGLMPFFHAWGLYTVLNCSLLQGAKVVTLPAFLPELFLPALAKHKIGVLHVVPPLIQFLVGHPAVTSRDLESLRVVMCAAAPCPAAAAHALKDKAPNPIFFQEAYGMTETMPTHFTPLGHERLGSCGHLLPGVTARVMEVRDGEPTTPLPPNTPGELWVKSPGVMSGYLGDEEATRGAFTGDGWLRTGDIVTYDSDGYFYVVDRIKELIKVKGHQVSPSEVEAELRTLPGVVEAGVVGVPDDRTGEAVRAFVVKNSDSLTGEAVQGYIAGRLAPHKHLTGGVVFVDALPKSPAGKLLRRALKERGQ
ncbi:acyl-CoA ligase lcsD-like, partial [Portunus trituberculatus]|uniref:acyl-CoA ligase lcsD-like n=1 Tax=Portunus trituberculatus TaxID=210409 RepID=UPI001E1CD9A5